MKTTDFIKAHCSRCGDFDSRTGCQCLEGEECDAAFNAPKHRGRGMRDRVDAFCQDRHIPQSNSTKQKELVYSLGEHDETLDDIIMQIWNDGAEGVFYAKSDLREFEGRIKKVLKKYNCQRKGT